MSNLTRPPAASVARDLAGHMKLPKPVADAYEAHQAAMATTEVEGPDPIAEASTAPAKAIPDLIRRFAAAQALTANIAAAKAQVIDTLERRVYRHLQAHGADIIEALAGPFNTAAQEYADAAQHLPAELSADAILRAGADAARHYETAVRAGATLTHLDKLRRELELLGIRARESHLERWTRVLDLDDVATIERLKGVNAERDLGRWIGYLRTPGVRRIYWHTLDEQRDALARLEAGARQPVAV